MGYEPKFFGCDGLDGILNVENFDTSLAEGVMLLTPYSRLAERPVPPLHLLPSGAVRKSPSCYQP
mgnify:CR=1 FL=1